MSVGRVVSKAIRKMVGWLIISIVFLVTSGASSLLSAVPVTIALGICHRHWPAAPPLGLGEVFVMLWALRLVTPYRIKVNEPKLADDGQDVAA